MTMLETLGEVTNWLKTCGHSNIIDQIPYGMKILHGIKFYGFTVSAITVKFNSLKYYSYTTCYM